MRKRLIFLNALIATFILFSQNLAIAVPVLPIAKITPGAINLAVTQSNISSTTNNRNFFIHICTIKEFIKFSLLIISKM